MGKRVLFVDDVADWRRMLSGLLADYGYAVTTVGGSPEARRALAQDPFDLAIFDMRLDETDENNQEGLDLARYVRQTYPSLPVIILTGYGTFQTTEMAMQPDEETGQRLTAAFVSKDDMSKLPDIMNDILAKSNPG